MPNAHPVDTDTPAEESPSPSRWRAVQPWITLLVRLSMAGILIAAAIPKALDLDQSVYAVRAYRLLPDALEPIVGVGLPFFELALAALLIFGAFTRASSIVWLVMMAGFTFGILWAWGKGYNIDCGCFGGGGDIDEDLVNYPAHLLERAGFVVLGAFLLAFPRTPLSLDAWMRGEPVRPVH